MISKITKIEFLPISLKATNWDQSTLVVKITDEHGNVGIGEGDGETNALKAYLEQKTLQGWSQNFASLLIGKDPQEIEALWTLMYDSTGWPGTRGFGLFAISAIDIALHDLAAKQLKRPVYKIMGGAKRLAAQPYATLYPSHLPEGAPLNKQLPEFKVVIDKAKAKGFKMVKLSISAPNDDDDSLIAFIRACRAHLGTKTELAVDFLYRWTDWKAAQRVLNELEDVNLYFAEACLHWDDLIGHGKLAKNVKTRLNGAEMATSIYEVWQWITIGGCAIVMPDINRCGGLTAIRKIANLAELYGVQCFPHGWKTGITAACGVNYHLAIKNAKYFEYLDEDLYESPLRRSLVNLDFKVTKGQVLKGDWIGLGLSLNEKFLKEIDVK